jgi:hypothetical protein
MSGFGRRLHRSRETIRKYFALPRCAIPGERLKNHVVTTLRIWRPIPGAVKGDEDTPTVSRRKLFLVVQHHGVWGPMGGEYRKRSDFVRTRADRFAAVATIFGRQNQLLLEGVVVALGPAIVSPRL